jgi:hypothetical protein
LFSFFLLKYLLFFLTNIGPGNRGGPDVGGEEAASWEGLPFPWLTPSGSDQL